MRSKVVKAVSAVVEESVAALRTREAEHAELAQEIATAGLGAANKKLVDPALKVCASDEPSFVTLTAMCKSLEMRLGTLNGLEDELRGVFVRWTTPPVDGCERFCASTHEEVVQKQLETLVEGEVDDFVADAADLLVVVAGNPDVVASVDDDDEEDAESSESGESSDIMSSDDDDDNNDDDYEDESESDDESVRSPKRARDDDDDDDDKKRARAV